MDVVQAIYTFTNLLINKEIEVGGAILCTIKFLDGVLVTSHTSFLTVL